MKKPIKTLALVSLFWLNANSQTTNEIPLKNGMVYYTFSNTLTNTKKCLAKYTYEASQKWGSKASEATTKKDRPFFGKQYGLAISQIWCQSATNPAYKGGCQDTAKIPMPTFFLQLPVKIKPNNLYNFVKEKIVSQTIEAKMELVFISKNEYVLKMKGFTYKCMTSKAGKIETKEIPLGEMYQDYLNENKKSKQESNLYDDINSLVNETDKIIRESLSETYKVDELD
jgi:hypothetical protein